MAPLASVSDADETTPLIISGGSAGGPMPGLDPAKDTAIASRAEENGTATTTANKPPPKPLPTLQIFLICYARIMEPVAFFSIFPYIAAMVQRNGRLPESDVGFYSGLIESLFSVTQVAVLIYWGRLADSLGRRPVLLWSLAGMAVGPALFGMATSIWQMILFRCVAGAFSGSLLILRTLVFDHCTPENQARAFSWFAFAGNVGIFLGSILGGFLADPAAQYPTLFGGNAFLVRYPYAAPGFAMSLLAASCVVACFFFLDETLDKEALAKARRPSTSTSTSGTARPTTLQLLRTPEIVVVLTVNASVMVMAFAFTSLLPVYLYTPIRIGGLGLPAFEISVYMASQGASQAFWLLAVFPPLHRRLGTKRLLMACAVGYPFFFASYVALNALLRLHTPVATAWACVIGVLSATVGPGVCMAFTGVQLALNDAAPDPLLMGTLNGISLTIGSAMRSFTPAATTAIYAVGVRNQTLWGYLGWVAMILLSMLMWIVIPKLPDDKRDEKYIATAAEDDQHQSHRNHGRDHS